MAERAEQPRPFWDLTSGGLLRWGTAIILSTLAFSDVKSDGRNTQTQLVDTKEQILARMEMVHSELLTREIDQETRNADRFAEMQQQLKAQLDVIESEKKVWYETHDRVIRMDEKVDELMRRTPSNNNPPAVR